MKIATHVARTGNLLIAQSVSKIIFSILGIILLAGLAGDGRSESGLVIRPTVLMVEKAGELGQVVKISLPAGLAAGAYLAQAEQGERKLESKVVIAAGTTVAEALAPACPEGVCPTAIKLTGPTGAPVLAGSVNLPYQRRWKIFLSPFSHIDVGFTNSQRKILAQNLDNLRVALDLIQQTRDYPEPARFKFFTEVSWPLSVFMYSEATTPAEKEAMAAALKSGQIEVGGFFISHADKFMPAEALFRSPTTALKLGRDFGTAIRTGCLNDLMDFSAIVKPLHSAGIPYFLGGPNTSRYVTPPLFYLQPAVGDERVLSWLTPNLNGYGENFDFAMRAALPISDASLAEIAKRLGGYLQSLQDTGAPPANVAAHFDFYGAHWPYPYDLYLLPFYPAHAVDNGPQDITASELAKLWNARYAYPRLIVSTPAEFFSEVEEKYRDKIPTLRGELAGFWGEQVFFAFAQVDPRKESIQRWFENYAINSENAEVWSLLRGQSGPDGSADIARRYELISLNNDHNPGPVPLGHTNYTKADVAEWKKTRQDWIEEISRTEISILPWGLQDSVGSFIKKPVVVTDDGENMVLEDHYYRIVVDKKIGGITSLFDKELGRELAGRDGKYLLDQYVVVAREENAGQRGNLFSRPGFSKVEVKANDKGQYCSSIVITGRPARNPDALKVLTNFIHKALGIRVPTVLIRMIEPILKVNIGPVTSVSQKISLCGSKVVYFDEEFKVDREQAIDHTFAFPLNVPKDRPLIVEGAYSPYRFAPGPPLGNGDLIPAARMIDTNFPGINDLTIQFEWIQGVPADAVFRSYVLAMGDGFGIAFSSRDSGVILPGPIDKDPLRGPFGGGFYHLDVGWTVYSKALLGTPGGVFKFRNMLTSFAANDEAEGKAKAAAFGQSCDHFLLSDIASSSNHRVLIAAMRPISDRAFLMRLYEASGEGTETTIKFTSGSIASAVRAREDGEPLAGAENLKTGEREFGIKLGPGEVAVVRVELVR